MITTQIKDAVLKFICENCPIDKYSSAPLKKLKPYLPDITADELFAILSQFQRRGLIEELNCHPNNVAFIALLEASDFLQRGGFSIQEELFQKTYDKLYLEIESLRKEFPDKAKGFLSILSEFATIGTAIGATIRY
jgi:hypothetical protein